MNATDQDALAGMGKDLFIAQYEALRSEILQRLTQRQELLTYTQIGAASFLSIGLQPGVSAVTVLAYPPLAFFFACAWGQHDNRIGQINSYLQEIEERHLQDLGPGWEAHRRSLWKKSRKTLSDSVTLPARGIFVGSELLALLVGIARFTADPHTIAVFVLLTVADIVAGILTLMVLKSRRNRVVGNANEGVTSNGR